MTDIVLRKLEEAFAVGASDGEACFYADISKTAFYEYQQDHPEFTERKEALKERPVLLARQSVVKGMAEDSQLALKYLERKRGREFATRVIRDDTVESVNQNVNLDVTALKDDEINAKLNALRARQQAA